LEKPVAGPEGGEKGVKSRKRDGKGRRIAALEARVTALEEQLRFYRDQCERLSGRTYDMGARVTELQHVTWRSLQAAHSGIPRRHTADPNQGIPRSPREVPGTEEGG